MAVPKKESEIPMVLSEVRYSGVFDYDLLYKTIHRWLKDHFYEVHESPYKHKMTPTGAEVELTITGWRKQTDWVKFIITADTHFWDITDVEVVKEGKKQKLNKGRFWIRFKMTVIFDWQKQFEGKAFYVKLFNLLRNKIMLMQLMLGPVDDLYYETYRLQAEVKKVLEMDTSYNAFRNLYGHAG